MAAGRTVQVAGYLGQSFGGRFWHLVERPSTPDLRSFSPTPGLGEVFPWQSFTTLNSCQAFNALNKISIPHQEQLQSGKLIEADQRLPWGPAKSHLVSRVRTGDIHAPDGAGRWGQN